MKTLLFMLFFVLVVAGLILVNQAGAPAVAQVVPTPLPVEVGQGVYLPMSYIQSVVGEVPVRVIASPNLTASKTTLPDGRLEIALPVNYGPGLSALTVTEAQEHTLRQLMQTGGDALIDTTNSTVDDAVLRQMAAAPVGRVEPPSQVFSTYLFSDLAKTAIQEQRQLAEHALDTQADVAKAGLASNVVIATSGDVSQSYIASCWPIAILAVAVAFLIAKKWLNGGNNNKDSFA